MHVKITRQSLALQCLVSSEKKKNICQSLNLLSYCICNQNHRTTCTHKSRCIKTKMHFKILSASTQISICMPDLLYPASRWNCTLETSPIGWSGDWTVPEGLCQFYAVLGKQSIKQYTKHLTCTISYFISTTVLNFFVVIWCTNVFHNIECDECDHFVPTWGGVVEGVGHWDCRGGGGCGRCWWGVCLEN